MIIVVVVMMAVLVQVRKESGKDGCHTPNAMIMIEKIVVVNRSV
jgi:hypothetical protein